jgi:tetratricopeptide (TPR) repeat protein
VKRPAAWLALLAVLASPVLAPAGKARAAEEAPESAAEEGPIDLEKLQRERAARESLYPVRARISRYLEAAAKAADAGKTEEALATLGRLDPKRLNPYERALVYRLEAHVAYAAGDAAAALASFEKVLAEEVLPVRDEVKVRFNIAQLHAALQQWRETIAALDRWMRYVEEPDPLGYYLRAIAHYQLDERDAALADARTAVDRSPEPPESWLQLLAALYVQREDHESAAAVLEELVLRFPKRQYWVQLSLIYGARDDYRRSLAVQQMAYLQGFLVEDRELRRLARTYLYNELPYPAAKVIEKGLADGTIERDSEALELLANSWIAAREYDRALAPLREAAERAENGNLAVRLGQVYMQRERWKEATEALQQGVGKGGLKDPGNAQLLLGICYYNDDRVEQARSWFARAREHDSTREAADRWITHLEREVGAAGAAAG